MDGVVRRLLMQWQSPRTSSDAYMLPEELLDVLAQLMLTCLQCRNAVLGCNPLPQLSFMLIWTASRVAALQLETQSMST